MGTVHPHNLLLCTRPGTRTGTRPGTRPGFWHSPGETWRRCCILVLSFSDFGCEYGAGRRGDKWGALLFAYPRPGRGPWLPLQRVKRSALRCRVCKDEAVQELVSRRFSSAGGVEEAKPHGGHALPPRHGRLHAAPLPQGLTCRQSTGTAASRKNRHRLAQMHCNFGPVG